MTNFETLDFTSQTAIVFCDRFSGDKIREFTNTNDPLLWIEYEVLDQLGIRGIATDAGLRVAENVESYLEMKAASLGKKFK